MDYFFFNNKSPNPLTLNRELHLCSWTCQEGFILQSEAYVPAFASAYKDFLTDHMNNSISFSSLLNYQILNEHPKTLFIAP